MSANASVVRLTKPRVAFGWNCHCEECSDEAIKRTKQLYDPWIASLRSQ